VTLRREKRLPLEELEPYLLAVPPLTLPSPPGGEGKGEGAPPAPLGWQAVFGNAHPVEIEVGFGKGLFLVNAATACPAVNFVGVEIERKYQLFAATRLAKRGLRNVRLVKADARTFLRDCVAPASVQAVHVYFPDPWWKKRHQKRRVFTAEFAAPCERVLRPGGLLHVVTDVAEYFGVMTALLAENTRLEALPPPDEKAPSHDLDYLTNFERKFRKEGRPIYRGTFRRTDPVS
jgi:tRNA (guanine-N7-)-methyltransferase